MAFAPEDCAKFNQLLDQALADPEARNSLKSKLGVVTPPAEPKVVTKAIEDKVYRRVDKFTGAAGTWQEWSFSFVNATSGVNKDIGSILERIGQQCETQLTPETLGKVVNEETREKHGPELFTVLCGLTSGEASSVVRGILSKHNMRCGFAAYFMLSVRFNPKTPARALQFLHTVVNPTPIKDVRLIPQGIESWESRRAVMENEFGERLSDRMAAAIVTAMLPLEFQDRIYQAQGAREVVYSEVRDKVLSVAGCRIQASQPTPMDVGAVTKADPGDTWGDETAADADRVNEEINQIKGNGKGTQCYRCGGYGHMARTCSTPAVKGEPKGKGKGYGDDGKGGKGYGKESRECYNCGKKGHLSKDCWSVKPKGKGKGKDVNEVADAAIEVGGVWMIAGVEEASLTPLQVNQMWRQNSLTPTQISNYWDDIWSETEDEDEEELDEPPTMVKDISDEEFEKDVIEGPPGIVNFCGTWEQTPLVEETISKFDLLFRRPEETKEEEFEIVEDDEEIGGVSTEYPSANGELFDWDELDGRPGIFGVFDVNAVESKVKIAIDSAAAESVCPFGWAEQFAVKPCAPGQEQSFVNASGGTIKHFGEKKVALLTKGSSGQDRTIGLPFQACDVKRPLAAVRRICEKGNIVQFGPEVKDNFIQNVNSKEKIWLKQERGQYIMEASLVTDSPF